MRKKDVVSKVTHIEARYCDLVWYARADKTDPTHPGRSAIEHVRENNPEAVAALCGGSADWQHGFNSGCLAIARLVLGWLGTQTESSIAELEFPNLDT
jgi:hypothetical protein